ncbi:MAG TPA: glycine cleavage system protein GcvH [Bacteroidaceae bacterium]|nr:glycine cleavage system protein GcvH [Bacteroidaceae bacterium]
MSKVIEGLFYTESHEWVKIEDNIGYIGISDFAQKELGDIVYVDMPELGSEISKGEIFGAVESVKAASDLYSPVGGTIEQCNAELTESPELLNQDSYSNWIIKVKMSNIEDVKDLMSASEYKKLNE